MKKIIIAGSLLLAATLQVSAMSIPTKQEYDNNRMAEIHKEINHILKKNNSRINCCSAPHSEQRTFSEDKGTTDIIKGAFGDIIRESNMNPDGIFSDILYATHSNPIYTRHEYPNGDQKYKFYNYPNKLIREGVIVSDGDTVDSDYLRHTRETYYQQGDLEEIHFNKDDVTPTFKKVQYLDGTRSISNYNREGLLVEEETNYPDGRKMDKSYTNNQLHRETFTDSNGDKTESEYKNGVKFRTHITYKHGGSKTTTFADDGVTPISDNPLYREIENEKIAASKLEVNKKRLKETTPFNNQFSQHPSLA